MQHKIGYLFKVSLDRLQDILLMHDAVWGTALHEQHIIYTHLRSLASNLNNEHVPCNTNLQSSLLLIFPQNDNGLMAAGLKEILLHHPLKWFISWGDRASFLPFSQIHTYTTSVSVKLLNRI